MQKLRIKYISIKWKVCSFQIFEEHHLQISAHETLRTLHFVRPRTVSWPRLVSAEQMSISAQRDVRSELLPALFMARPLSAVRADSSDHHNWTFAGRPGCLRVQGDGAHTLQPDDARSLSSEGVCSHSWRLWKREVSGALKMPSLALT